MKRSGRKPRLPRRALLAEHQQLQEQLARLESDNITLRQQRQQWQETTRQHEEQLRSLQETLQQTQEALQEKQAPRAAWDEELVGLRRLVHKQQAQLALLLETEPQAQEMVRLQEEHRVATQQHQTLQQRAARLEEERQKLAEEDAQLRTAMQAQQQARTTAESLVARLQQEATAAQQELTSLRQQTEALQHTVSQSQAQNRELQAHYTKALQNLQAVQEQLQHSTAQAEALQKHFDMQGAQQGQETTRPQPLYEQSAPELFAVQRQREALRTQVTQLERDIASLRAERDQWQEAMQQRATRLAALEEELSKMRLAPNPGLAGLQELRAAQEREVTQLREAAVQARQLQQDLLQQVQMARTDTQAWQTRSADLTRTLAQVQEQLQHLDTQKAQSAQEITRLQTLHEQTIRQLKTLQAEIAKREEDMRRLETAQDASQETEFKHLRQAVMQTREALLAMQQQVQEARTESQQWQARHAEAGRSLTELQEQRTPMIQELGRLQALYEQATQRLAEVTQQQEHIRAQAQETRLESQQWHERYVATEDFLTAIQDRLQQTVGKTTMAAQRLKTLQEDLVQLRQALAAPDK